MALKDMYNQDSVSDLAIAIGQVYPVFDREAFFGKVFSPEWPELELKQRMRHITLALGSLLPGDYHQALDILRRAIPLLPKQSFEKMVFPDFVEVYGLEDYQTSIPALEYFTQFISAEFAVRHFIINYPEPMMAQMLVWATHDHEGVRRLASEGCRPRLPWGVALPALKKDPAPILQILEALKLDPSESVRRSVANNLNDISKDNPDVTLKVLNKWQSIDRPEIRATTRHALRTLIKAGHPGALALLGFPPPQVSVSNLEVIPQQITMGSVGKLSFTVESTADRPQALMIDYVLHLVRARGKTGTKVFKLAQKTIQPGESLQLEKTVSFEPITTRRYYPGVHAIEPQINGQTFDKVTFQLTEK